MAANGIRTHASTNQKHTLETLLQEKPYGWHLFYQGYSADL